MILNYQPQLADCNGSENQEHQDSLHPAADAAQTSHVRQVEVADNISKDLSGQRLENKQDF